MIRSLLLFTCLTGLSHSLMAHDGNYQAMVAEASDYRSWKIEELEQRLGANSELIPHFSCNGKDELDPFHPPVRQNPAGKSLLIKPYLEGEKIVYQQGEFFNLQGERLRKLDDLFFRHVEKALQALEALPTTARMLRLLETSYFPITIALGGNSFNPAVENGAFWSGIFMAQAVSFLDTRRMSEGPLFSNIGVGGDILWHPNLEGSSIEDDGVVRESHPYVALAHEMYHAYDSIRGLLDMRVIVGPKYESETRLEYRAVYFENLIRGEMGLRYRKHYSAPVSYFIDQNGHRRELQPDEIQDMLDDEGRPIYVPAPCL